MTNPTQPPADIARLMERLHAEVAAVGAHYAATSKRRAALMREAAATILDLSARLERVERALFDGEHDAALNLGGAHHDLTHKFNPNDGGVCARTIARVIEQLSTARRALGDSND